MSRISEVAVTGGVCEGDYLTYKCPHTADSQKEHNWLLYFLTELLKNHSSGSFKLPLNVAGTDYLVVDRASITSITITLS